MTTTDAPAPPRPDGRPDTGSPSGPLGGPVTVAVTRRATAARDPEMLAWVQAGQRLAEGFPGFLGAGWVRPGSPSPDWHMLYRFADPAALAGWEHSTQRAWWLASARGLAETAATERRTGIEGWFDAAAGTVLAAPPAAPPRWKQASVIWLGFFPTSLVLAVLLGPLTGGWNVALRVLASTLCATPVMTWLVLPRVTRALQWWLSGQPAPWRAAASRRLSSPDR